MSGGNVLSQSEIDKLLKSVNDEEEVSNVEPKSFIAGSRVNFKKDIKKYDFKRPKKFTKEHMKTLTGIYDNFTKYLSSYFVSLFSTQIKIEIMSKEQITFHEFIFSMPNPTTILSFEMAPLVGNMYISLECALSCVLLNSLLGSNTRRQDMMVREFSDIDKRVLFQVANEILNILKTSWESLLENVDTKFKSLETNPATIQALGPNEPILLITLKIEFDGDAYFMNLCLPYIAIEKISDNLDQDYIVKSGNQDDFNYSKELIRSELDGVNIILDAILDKKIITVQDFLSLKNGDIIVLDKKYNSSVSLYIEDKIIFSGILGLVGDNKGVKILDSYYSKEVLRNEQE